MKDWKATEFGAVIDQYKAEFETYYSEYPSDVGSIEAALDTKYAENMQATAFEKKRWVYEAVADNCAVKVFRYCPFYFEVNTGADRNLIGAAFPPTAGLGSWVMRHDPTNTQEEFDAWHLPYMNGDIIYSTMYADFAHNAMPVENILKLGFEGIRERTEQSLKEGTGDCDYLRSVLAVVELVAKLANRFSEAAQAELRRGCDVQMEKRLRRIATSALKCPMKPAETFFEALNTLLYMKELANSVDSAGVAILGRVDMILQPYLERDLENGTISYEEARDLIYWFCSITDSKWDLGIAVYGTNTSLNIGGCDREGKPVFNDVTQMIIQAYMDLKLINPKLQARVSCDSNVTYLEMLGRLAASGSNVLSIFNDDVIIDAQIGVGKRIEDARDYTNGGCQEVLLAGTEFNSRAYCYLSPCRYLEMMMFPEQYAFFEKERILPKNLEHAADFSEFSRRVFLNLAYIINAIAWHFNEFEKRWPKHSPFPIMSAGYAGCLDKGLDLTQGGAQYNNSSFAIVGIATFIDSLWAIKTTVFEEKRFSYGQLLEMLRMNFEGFEKERAYLIHKLEKLGEDGEALNCFAAEVMENIASVMANMRNTRGGIFEASVWSYYGYEWMKGKCGAMANGKLHGERLSRGINPSESTTSGVAAMLHSLRRLECKRFPQTVLSYLTLPLTLSGNNEILCTQLIRLFVDCGGSSADFDVLNTEALQDALLHPDAHRNLVVRVCGYSARFVDLEPEMQKEIIERYQRT